MPQNKLNILHYPVQSWVANASAVIQNAIEECLLVNSVCNVMLTGGVTAKKIYQEWAIAKSLPLERIHFFFGDERCISPDDQNSNFFMVMSSLFSGGIIEVGSISRMEGELPDRALAASRYENLLPNHIDVLILGLGLDGHIASLFPGHSALEEELKLVVSVSQVGVMYDRISITPRLISQARKVFLLATGAEKGKVLAKALSPGCSNRDLPVCLTLDGTWLLDNEAYSQLLINK